jgi:hypothetical protein
VVYTAETLPWGELIFERVPRIHPNGYIQVDIDQVTRLHVWPPAPIQQHPSVSPIHNHSFSFTSTVIFGRLTDISYLVFDEEQARAQYRVYTTEQANAIDTRLLGTPRYVTAIESRRIRHQAGETYSRSAREFHESSAGGLTATILTKTEMIGTPPAILVPAFVAPDEEYRRDVERSFRPVIRDILEALSIMVR